MYGHSVRSHRLSAEQIAQVITEVQANPQWGTAPAKVKEETLEDLYGHYLEQVVEDSCKKIKPAAAKAQARKPRKPRAKKDNTPSE
ncbi:hypothetical protein HK097_009900 [Rhizophlyctis rosea]|uniref:Uncharacterized protein n=1 Tax=Rhizophlyctis rosea TaxID=64517 RepID=A0AAD5X3G6_9FUNG|nr:hypothetical protein HK097_009900 [Rhizophlyctis rosea]